MILQEVFETGKDKIFKQKIPDPYKNDRTNLDSKLGVFSINLMAFPIKLDNLCIGVLELSNKK